jgi:diguanylate cyclase (GGDEF)-like protein
VENNTNNTLPSPKFFVAGAAHLDVISVAIEQTGRVDKQGTLHLDIGGTGLNLANNLRDLGGPVTLLTALPCSPFTDIILDNLQENGIQVFAKNTAGPPLGGFSVHLDSKGTLLSAVSSCPVEHYQFDGLEIDEALQFSCAALADCNLSLVSLAKVAERAAAAKVPFFVAGVSQEKSLKLEVCLDLGHTFFIKKDELYFFLNNTGRRHLTESLDGPRLSQETGSNWVVSDGGGEISFYSEADSFSMKSALQGQGAGNSLQGAGTVLMAAVVWHMAQGRPARKAVELGLIQATRIAGRKACNVAASDGIEGALNRITKATRTDPLTKLYNRRGLDREMNSQAMKAMARKGLVTVLLLDIDNFKSVNDDFGHSSGDLVLAWLAAQLQFSARETDVIGRWGGEEFILLLPGEALAGASLVAERIRNRIQELSDVAEFVPRQITVSIGVACCEPGETFDSTINRADQALYRAKEGGRNRTELAPPAPQ